MFTDCANETFTSAEPLKIFYVQKDDLSATIVDGKANSVILMDGILVAGLFNSPSTTFCPIKQWFMADLD